MRSQTQARKESLTVNVLLDKLVRAAGAEFTTFYYYTILRVNAIGFDGEGLKEIIEEARIEDRATFAGSPTSPAARTHTCPTTPGT